MTKQVVRRVYNFFSNSKIKIKIEHVYRYDFLKFKVLYQKSIKLQFRLVNFF